MIKIDGIEYSDSDGVPLLATATRIEAYNCPALTHLDAPAATHVKVWDCPALARLDAPAATHVEVWDCDALPKETKK